MCGNSGYADENWRIESGQHRASAVKGTRPGIGTERLELDRIDDLGFEGAACALGEQTSAFERMSDKNKNKLRNKIYGKDQSFFVLGKYI